MIFCAYCHNDLQLFKTDYFSNNQILLPVTLKKNHSRAMKADTRLEALPSI